MKGFTTDGVSHMALVDNVFFDDTIRVYNSTGGLLSAVSSGLALGTITWDGSFYDAIEAGPNPARLYQFTSAGAFSSGPHSFGPYSSPLGIGFAGGELLLADLATGTAGLLTITLHKVDPVTFSDQGAQVLTINTGTSITSTPVYGIAEHAGDLFLGLQGLNVIYEFSGASLVQQIPIPTLFPRGIGFIGNDLFVADRGTVDDLRSGADTSPGVAFVLSDCPCLCGPVLLHQTRKPKEAGGPTIIPRRPAYTGGRVCHFPRVKSGNFCGALPCAILASLKGPGALNAAAS
jgi:hypothetical protein